MQIDPFEVYEDPDYHAIYSIQLCELVNDGFDVFGDPRWDALAWFSAEQRARFEEKFTARFWFREIGITPPGEWRHELTRVMGEVLPKYRQLYQQIENGAGPLASSDSHGKERRVFSDFPATQLDPSTNDYARSANDYEYERIEFGDLIDKADAIRSRYNDVDVLLLDEVEGCFSCLMTVSMNGV